MNAPVIPAPVHSSVLRSAKQAGFHYKGMTTNNSAYMLLHPSTNGDCGRRVFIASHLSSVFTGMEPDDIDSVFHELTKLKAIAGNITSFSAKEKAGQHITILGKVQVNYDITQDAVGRKPGGVYINAIELASFKQHAAGLYKVAKSRNKRWSIADQASKTIDTKLAAINGLCDDVSQAARRIIPDMLDKAYSPGKEGINVYTEGEYSLLYNPPEMYYKGRQYESTSTNSRVTMNELKKALISAQRNGHKVRWVVHGDGAHVLYNALCSLPARQNLSLHTMMFLNPTEDVAQILPLMRKHQIQLHQDVQKIHESDVLSLKAQMGNHKALKRELEQFPDFETKAKALSQQSLHSRDQMADHLISAGLLGSSVTAAATAALGLSVAALPALASAGAYGAYKSYRSATSSAKNYRNMLATEITDPDVNPHLTPYQDTADLNTMMSKRFGGLGRSFYSVIKHKITGRV
jgi:hypothetical protein